VTFSSSCAACEEYSRLLQCCFRSQTPFLLSFLRAARAVGAANLVRAGSALRCRWAVGPEDARVAS
jgi:hypothetical protein